MERWRQFHTTHCRTKGAEYNRHWEISDHGRVRWTYDHTDRITYKQPTLTGGHHKSGRYYALSINNATEKYIHRLVALFFVDNPEDKKEINHIDGNKLNNHYTNLEWCTSSENNIHKMKLNGTWDEVRWLQNQHHQRVLKFKAILRKERIMTHKTLYTMGVKIKDIAKITGHKESQVRSDVKKKSK